MEMLNETEASLLSEASCGAALHCWYCPALGAYRTPDEILPPYWQHLLTTMPWVPLYALDVRAGVPECWTLRSYYSETEDEFYASHRTMSEKTKQGVVRELYALPGAYGNESAKHVPPLK